MAQEIIYSIDPGGDWSDLTPEFVGVAIRCQEKVSVDGDFLLTGLFQLPAADLELIDEQPHRALVVVSTLGGSWYVDSPLRQKIFFPDDLHPAGSLLRGYFSFDLFNLFQDRVPGAYRLSVSLGEHLSESVLVEVV